MNLRSRIEKLERARNDRGDTVEERQQRAVNEIMRRIKESLEAEQS
jgi:hypothetical protein